MGDVALLLEDSNRGQDRVICQGLAVGHGCNQVVDSRFAAPPEDLHEPEFGFGQRVGSFGRHPILLIPIVRSRGAGWRFRPYRRTTKGLVSYSSREFVFEYS